MPVERAQVGQLRRGQGFADFGIKSRVEFAAGSKAGVQPPGRSREPREIDFAFDRRDTRQRRKPGT